MLTKPEWQALKNEFGDPAFNRVVLAGKSNYELHHNSSIDHFAETDLADEMPFKLKPLRDLWAHDDSFYIDAFVMWQWRYVDGSNDWKDCNKPLSFKADKEYRRKDSAGLPFDLERAKAGDAVEFLEYPQNNWIAVTMLDFEGFKLCVEWKTKSHDCSALNVKPCNLRMKYPPRKPS